MTKMIVDQEYWNKSYDKYSLSELPDNDTTRRLISEVIPRAKNGETAFELGCYPGRFLREVGRLGYTLNGCDLAPGVVRILPDWLRSHSCSVGDFLRVGYDSVESDGFDLVCSFGFVEHFVEFGAVVRRHAEMTKPGGIIVIQAPNFSGAVQFLLRYALDRDNLENHVYDAMILDNIVREIPSNFEVVRAEYYGGFDFWHDDYRKRAGILRRIILRLLYKSRVLWKFIPNSSLWSPYFIVVAKRMD